MINSKSYTCAELNITHESVTKFENIRFYSVRETDEFRVYGLFDYKNTERFVRMPEAVAETVSDGVKDLNYCTAGARVRFVTTSDYLAIRTKSLGFAAMQQTNSIAAAGFDIYINNGIRDTYAFSFTPYNGLQNEDGMCAIRALPKGIKEITVNLPLRQSLYELYIGLDETSELTARTDYKFEKPVLYYGSSITQGFCASRPGMAYESLISRRLDTNFQNLGFAGKCHAEEAMADYLSTFDCSVFVYDYDHNSNPKMLAERHENLYLKFRSTHPTTPVIIVGRPDFYSDFRLFRSDEERREAVISTYHNALARGENVFYIDGYALFSGEDREDCTVDLVHPNDVGMVRMADVIGKAVEKSLADVAKNEVDSPFMHP